MIPDILKPLVIFSSHSQSQEYIKRIRNLGDAWRTLAEVPSSETDAKATIIETNFDFIMKITNALDPEEMSVEMLASTEPQATTKPSSSPPSETTVARHYRIFEEYESDLIWRSSDDIRWDEGEDSSLDSEEVLSSFPPSVLEHYDRWIDVFSDNFKARLMDTQDYHAEVFVTPEEEIAWDVTGYLLAWRIMLSPEVGSILYSAGGGRYMLERGKETSVTREFLKDRLGFLKKRKA